MNIACACNLQFVARSTNPIFPLLFTKIEWRWAPDEWSRSLSIGRMQRNMADTRLASFVCFALIEVFLRKIFLFLRLDFSSNNFVFSGVYCNWRLCQGIPFRPFMSNSMLYEIRKYSQNCPIFSESFYIQEEFIMATIIAILKCWVERNVRPHFLDYLAYELHKLFQ